MSRRQTVPRQWLIVEQMSMEELQSLQRLSRGSGVLVIGSLRSAALRRFRRLARTRGLQVVLETSNTARRVHNVRELRRAVLQRVPLILLSPLFPTRSHSDWKPLPRMRAAALARLAGRKLIALGGMDARRYARVKHLGFQGWAGISAFRT
jgi:thiamine-phosphate pyrophosphorylase